MITISRADWNRRFPARDLYGGPLEMHEIDRVEMLALVHGGGMTPRWMSSADGDVTGDDGTLHLDANLWPPGTVVTVHVPKCPRCGHPAAMPYYRCDDGTCSDGDSRCAEHVWNGERWVMCDFDWDEWSRRKCG